MPMQSAMLAFALFRVIQHRLHKPLSPTELTLIEIIAGALGLAPFTSGFTSFIPGLEFLTTPDEGGPIFFNTIQLLLWSIAMCGLGIVTAAPFRRLFILRERLRYPSATATGTLIGAFFSEASIVSRASQPVQGLLILDAQHLESSPRLRPSEAQSRDQESLNLADSIVLSGSSDGLDQGFVESGNSHAVAVLLVPLAGSAFFVRHSSYTF